MSEYTFIPQSKLFFAKYYVFAKKITKNLCSKLFYYVALFRT